MENCSEITALGGISDVQPLGARRWSDSGLKYAQHIVMMLAAEEREVERREDEQLRIKVRERAALKVA